MSTQVKMFRSLALALIILGISACASAPTEEGAMFAADLDPVVCKQDANTGSRLQKKTNGSAAISSAARRAVLFRTEVVSSTFFGLAGAVDTEQRRRVELEPFRVNVLATLLAVTEFVIVQAIQRRVDPTQHLLTPLTRCLRHGLSLHGIHARQPAHLGLVKLDDGRSLIASIGNTLELFPEREQPVAPHLAHDAVAAP